MRVTDKRFSPLAVASLVALLLTSCVGGEMEWKELNTTAVSSLEGSSDPRGTGDSGTGASSGVGAVAAPFDPKSLSGLELWVKGDDVDGMRNGTFVQDSVVSTWIDHSGNNRHLTGATTPLMKKAHVNGVGAVYFNNVAAGGFAPVTVGAASPVYSVFTVSRLAAPNSMWAPIMSFGTDWSDVAGLTYAATTSDTLPIAFGLNTFGGSTWGTTMSPALHTAWNIVFAEFHNQAYTSFNMEINGVPVAMSAVNSGSSSLPHSNKAWVGADCGQEAFLGDIAEVLIYSTSTTAAERLEMTCLLASKYGITASGCAAAAVAAGR